jgi:hypothetical protein
MQTKKHHKSMKQQLFFFAFLLAFVGVKSQSIQVTPATVPYYCNFEDSTENSLWTLSNGTQPNKWFINTTVCFEGTHSLYISKDSGMSNSYLPSEQSFVYAYRTIDFSASNLYEISFNWQCSGSIVSYGQIFLVPASVNIEAGETNGINPFNIPEGWLDISAGILYNSSTWKKKVNRFNVVTPGIYNLIVFWNNTPYPATYNPPLSIDNIRISDCISIISDSIKSSHITPYTESIKWNQGNNLTQWGIIYGKSGFNPDTVPEIYVDTNFVLLNNLTPNTRYDIYIRSLCDSIGNNMGMYSFLTAQIPDTLPYLCDFEDSINSLWTLNNGTQANKWHIDTAAKFSGDYGLYISNNNGISNTYSPGSSYVYAYRTLYFPDTNSYLCYFDWKGKGWTGWSYSGGTFITNYCDLGRVFLVPENANLLPGNANGMASNCQNGIYNNTAPSNWIDLGQGLLTSNNEVWKHVCTEFSVPAAGIYHLVVFWKNGCVLNTNPPLAIDNIIVKPNSCPVVSNIMVSNILSSSAKISWTAENINTSYKVKYDIAGFDPYYADAIEINSVYINITGLQSGTSYDVYIQAKCLQDSSTWEKINFISHCGNVNLPYIEDFESYTATTYEIEGIVPNCWASFTNNISGSTSYETYPAFPAPHITSGNSYAAYPHSGTKSLGLVSTPNGSSYAILPYFSSPIENLKLSFWYRYESDMSGMLTIGYLTELQNDVTTFTVIDTVPPTTTISQYFFDFSEASQNIANAAYIAIRWNAPAYNWWTAAIDDIEVTADTTIISNCTPPFDIIANVSGYSADISWTATGNETQWLVAYKTDSDSNWEYISVTNIPATHLSFLRCDATYIVKVKTICSSETSSMYSYPCTFITYCDTISNLQVSNITQTSADLTWAEVPNISHYEIEYGIAGSFIPGNGTATRIDSILTNSYTLTNLSSFTHYDVAIRCIYDIETIASKWITTDFQTANCDSIQQCTCIFTGTDAWGDGWQGAYFTIEQNNIQIATINLTHGYNTATIPIAICDGSDVNIIFHNTTSSNITYSNEVGFTFISDSGDTLASAIGYPNNNSAATYYGLPHGATDTISCTAICTSCRRPATLIVSNITSNSTDLLWTNTDNTIQYILEYGLSNGFTIGNPQNTNIQGITETYYTLTDLNFNTNYTVAIRSDCGLMDSLSYWTITNFTTLLGSSTPKPKSANLLLLHPNPATTQLTICNLQFTNARQIEIYNLLGKLQLSITYNKSALQAIDVSALPAGVYIVRAGQYTGKFVKINN